MSKEVDETPKSQAASLSEFEDSAEKQGTETI